MKCNNLFSRAALALMFGVSGVQAGVLYQAENYTSVSGSSRSSTNSGFTGTGYVDFGGNGTWMEWNNINVLAAGRYNLTLRYANGSSGARQAAAIINGVNRGNVAFNATGGWTNWTSDVVAVDLRQGSNTVRIQANTSAGGPNIDSADVELVAQVTNPFGDNLQIDQELTIDQRLTSSNGQYFLAMQGDGNLVLRRASTSEALWSTQTNGSGAVRFRLQGDGNLVMRNAAGSSVWSSGTNGKGGVRLYMQDDGNLVLRNASGASVWSTGTAQVTADTTRPVITLNGSASIVITQGTAFTDPDATATDDRDGNITSRIVVSGAVLTNLVGTYTLLYNVRDAAGNAATTITRTIQVNAAPADTIKPVITLNGSASLSISQGSSFSDPGATANDNKDGNITSRIVVSGTVNTGVAGTYTLRYDVRDAAGNAATTVTRTVNVTSTGGGGGTGGGTGTGGTTQSTGEFSTPNAALYSLNDSRSRGFPRVIDTGFGGNGHAETWDGRIFVRTQTDGWFASAFRPERIVRTSDGAVDFKQGAFGTSILLESNAAAPNIQHNWLAILPDPSVTGENPYPSNSSGTYSSTGTYRTYKSLVYHTSKLNGDNDQMGVRKATFIVSGANTRDAQLVSAKFTSEFQKFRLQSGADFRCIEPSATIDGRLVICQGHPDNDGRIDNLVYSWNPTPGATTNWRAPKSIADMHWDDRLTSVAGVPFQVRFPIAEKPLRDATGNDYNRGELVKGAYPWVSHDGSEIFFQASREGVSARRTGTTVVGRWTGWLFRHIDGPINPYRHVASRLFLSSPGAFTTMWTPYKDVDDMKLPYSVRGPSYPIFGSNSHDYMEIGFDDYLDGNFVFYYGMNEQLDRAGIYQKTRTNDTSGKFNNGTLVGAKFPLEYNSRDEIVGRYGQAIYFPAGSYVDVAKTAGWNTLTKGVSVDFWVRKVNASGTVRLFTMQGGVEVYMTNGSTLNAAITDSANTRVVLTGGSVATNVWSHVAFTYDANTKEMKLYVNGAAVANRSAGSFGTLRTSGSVHIGPESSSALLLLDEVKLSNVTRQPHEIGHYANVRTNKAPNTALASAIPTHLRSLRFNATGVDRYSAAAASLGESLFNDVILSQQRTTSCSTCHNPTRAFTDGLAIAQGNEPTDAGVRNTPTLLNRLFSSMQGWGGLSSTLDTQALVPIQARHEMNLPIADAVNRLKANSTYASRFQQVYGEGPTAANIAAALASFQAVQFAPSNRVDEFRAGNRAVLSASERRGLDLFEGKARCSGCHSGGNFTDESFRNNGLTADTDVGRAEATGRNRDHRLFKVPSLREVAATAPYMHDGSFGSLRAVLEAYNNGAVNNPARDTDIRPLELTSQDITDLQAFLEALSN